MTRAFEIVIETITPQRARLMLGESSSFNNRPVKAGAVARYASDMKVGAWPVTGDSIKLDNAGRVIDGQHRLLACIDAGVPFTTAITYGLDTEVAQVVDQGTARSACDRFRMGDPDMTQPKLRAAAVRCYFGLERKGDFGIPISFTHIARILEDHPAIGRAVDEVGTNVELKLLYRGGSLPAALHAHLAERSTPATADRFFSLVAGVSVPPDSPVRALRTRLTHLRKRNLGGHNQSLRDRAATTIVAWNHWCADTPRHVLRWDGVWPLAASVRGG